MAEVGHIKLGAVNTTLRPYIVEGGPVRGVSRRLVNPYAEKLGSGEQRYQDDLQWEYWSMTDWQAGVGRTDPEGGGFLFGEVDSRVPGQLILPPLVKQIDERVVDGSEDDCRYVPDAIAGTVTIGGSGNPQQQLAVRFRMPTTAELQAAALTYARGFWLYARVPAGVALSLDIYDNGSGAPGSLVDGNANIFTGQDDNPNFYWVGADITLSGLTADTRYWAVIYPTDSADSFEVAYGDSGYTANTVKYWDGDSFEDFADTVFPLYTTNVFNTYITGDVLAGNGFIRFNGSLYMWRGFSLWKLDTANDIWSYVGSLDASAGSGGFYSAVVYGPTVYFSRDSGNYVTLSIVEAIADGGATATLFATHKGLLYRADHNDLYYSSDGSTWQGPFAMGPEDFGATRIRGMAGLGDNFYCATDRALLALGPGDWVTEVARFGSEDSGNGQGMIAHQGALYIPAAGRIYRFTEDGQFLDIWANKDNDLPASRLGSVSGLIRMNTWLVALVASDTANEPSLLSVWVWQTQGWHFLANSYYADLASYSPEDNAFYYDRGTGRLWFCGDFWSPVWYVEVPDYALNPYNLDNYAYMPFGWLETDWFDGRILEREKDFESVIIHGDTLAAATPVKVYWQDDGSTTWELLGSYDSDIEEIRFSDYTTRPNSKRFKLGLLLSSTSAYATPKVRAAVVKFLANIRDRYGWQLRILTGDGLEGTGGELLDTYTGAQQRAHLDALEKQAPPFLFEDPTGDQYEVRVIQAHHDYYSYERVLDGTTQIGLAYTWTIEQTQEQPYA